MINPTEQSDPIDNTGVDQRTEPVEPADPADPVDPVDPAEPAKLAEHPESETGPPVDPTEQRVREIVATINAEQPNLAARVIDCDPDLADTAQFVEAYGYRLDQSANTLVVIGKSHPPVFVACVVLANTRLDVNKVVRKKLGVKKCSFAPSETTEELTGMTVGGVTALGLSEHMPLWVDRRVMELPEIVLGGGSRACKFVGSPDVLTSLPNVEVVDDLAKPIPEAPPE